MIVSQVDRIKRLTPAQRARVGARAKELIEKELTLHNLREDRSHKPQARPWLENAYVSRVGTGGVRP